MTTTNTLWATVPPYHQERMVVAYLDHASCDPSATAEDALKELSTMNDDLLREHLRNGIGWTNEDEHDRPVDRPYMQEARDLEGSHDDIGPLGFMDMAHALSYAMQAMRERIEALYSQDPTTVLYVQRLKQSHDRVAELLLQKDEETFHEGDGFLTRQIDIWIRG